MNNIIDQLFQKVQALGDNFTSNTYQALSSAMGPVFTLMLTLYIIFWGYQFWQGRGGGSGAAMAFRLFRVAVIYALAIGWGDFQTFVYNAASDIPTSVGNIIVQNIGGSGTTGTDASQIEQSLSNVYLTGVDAASKLTSHAGWTNAGPYIYGALVWVAVALFVGFAAFLVIYAKIMLWVLLSLAPVFITLLLFNVTSRYFNGWLSALVQFVILPVLVYTLLGFFLTIMKDAVQTPERRQRQRRDDPEGDRPRGAGGLHRLLHHDPDHQPVGADRRRQPPRPAALLPHGRDGVATVRRTRRQPRPQLLSRDRGRHGRQPRRKGARGTARLRRHPVQNAPGPPHRDSTATQEQVGDARPAFEDIHDAASQRVHVADDRRPLLPRGDHLGAGRHPLGQAVTLDRLVHRHRDDDPHADEPRLPDGAAAAEEF